MNTSLVCAVVVWRHRDRRYALPAPGGPAAFMKISPQIDDPAWTFLGILHAGTERELLEARRSLDVTKPVRCRLAGAEVLADVAAVA